MAEAATVRSSSRTDAVSIRPQPGPQTDLLCSPADIAIAGGAAGGGKTYGLLIEALRHYENPDADVVYFRRTYPQITQPGGLWDDAGDLYPLLGGESNETDLIYEFDSGMAIKFAHMQHPKDRFAWKGAQVPLIIFDQLEDFEAEMFWYLTSRNRSARAGFKPYIRASCNPVPPDDPIGGWLNKLISWWIDQDEDSDGFGYAIPERAGMLRYFIRVENELHWGDSRAELAELFPDMPRESIKSLTFIPATLEDNPILMQADPDYRGWLMSLPRFERERLLKGNWMVQPEAGDIFDRAWFNYLDAMPNDVVRWVRYWDKAGTKDGGKYSAGVLMGVRENGDFLVADVIRGRWSYREREKIIKAAAVADSQLPGGHLQVWVEQEPGSGGKESAERSVRMLAGYDAHQERVTGSKLDRSSNFSAQVEAGNVYLLRRHWNDAYLAEHHRFDGESGFMDQVDASSGAFNKLTLVDVRRGVVVY